MLAQASLCFVSPGPNPLRSEVLSGSLVAPRAQSTKTIGAIGIRTRGRYAPNDPETRDRPD
jgi:hypothetical protein